MKTILLHPFRQDTTAKPPRDAGVQIHVVWLLLCSSLGFVNIASAQYVWRPVEGSYEAIKSLAYGNGVFVGLSETGLIFRSTDGGDTWTSASSGFGVAMGNKVLFDGTRFVVASKLFAATSTDGASWTAIKMGPTNNAVLTPQTTISRSTRAGSIISSWAGCI